MRVNHRTSPHPSRAIRSQPVAANPASAFCASACTSSAAGVITALAATTASGGGPSIQASAIRHAAPGQLKLSVGYTACIPGCAAPAHSSIAFTQICPSANVKLCNKIAPDPSLNDNLAKPL